MTTTPSSAPDRGAVNRAALEAMPGLREVLVELGLYEDLEVELDECVPPLLVSAGPARALLRRHRAHFDPAEVERFIVFCRKLRHIKGRWAGLPLVPDLWQVLYVLGPVFGWRRGDGNRLFSELWLEVPRKNGKSTLCSAIALYLLMADSNLKVGRLAEAGAEVYAAASTTSQAQAVFRPAEAMARRSPSLSKRLGILKDHALLYERTFSRFEVVSGAPSKAEEKHGFNVSGAVIDEVHVHKTRDLIEAFESGTGARDQPLLAFITTAGLEEEGTPYAEKRDFAEAVATGQIPEARTWAVIYTVEEADLDRWDERDVIEKANPGLGRSVSWDFLEGEIKKARRSEPKRLAFLRLYLNVRTGALSSWIPLSDFDRSGAHLPIDYRMLRNRVAYAGLDLASTTDLAALCLVVPGWVDAPTDEDPDRELEVLEVILRAWTPVDQLARRSPRERTLFEKWIRSGHLLTSPGQTIDYDAIELEAFKLADHLEISRLHFDRWGAKQLVQHLRDGGIRVLEMGQGFASMSAPMKETERLILEGRLRHGGNPVLRYAVEGLVVQQDAAGNIKPDRDKSKTRIDPFVALVEGVDAWSRETGGGESVYDERGLVTA